MKTSNAELSSGHVPQSSTSEDHGAAAALRPPPLPAALISGWGPSKKGANEKMARRGLAPASRSEGSLRVISSPALRETVTAALLTSRKGPRRTRAAEREPHPSSRPPPPLRLFWRVAGTRLGGLGVARGHPGGAGRAPPPGKLGQAAAAVPATVTGEKRRFGSAGLLPSGLIDQVERLIF
ncbi:hypothetical protein SKAU_G00188360 [Synaphobranchus kaupii]|uniref:Uncharacterized protein n=1 Tax=Synaphobranchus kaupii TaxID=118154 RepID=A0A9Q1FD67_SYNKA|nr:hypothetical protein SKAU_G00188360 [Synaphobranchus kaupii]